MKRTLGIISLLVMSCSGDAFVASRGDVDTANALLAEGKYADALAAYDALQSKNPRVAFNRGLALMGLEKWDEAIAAFDEARESKDASMKAQSYFHVGTVYAKQALAAERKGAPVTPATPAAPGKPGEPAKEEAADKGALPLWQSAVDALENALALQPDYPDAKQQLEIALLRVDPPCRLRNDTFEPNESFATAKDVELAEANDPKDETAAPGERRAKLDLQICPDDSDWFKVPLEPGDRLTAKVTKKAGPDQAKPAVSAWSIDGKSRLGAPVTTKPDAPPPTEVALAGITDKGDYHLLVNDPDGDDFAATFEITVRPACERTEGPEEPNDERANARPLEAVKVDPKAGKAPSAPPAGPSDPPPPDPNAAPMPGGAPGGAPEQKPTVGRLCPGNQDYFVVQVPAGMSLRVTADMRTQAGTPTLALEDADGKVLADGKPGQKKELVALAYAPSAIDSAVYVHLAGKDAEAIYALKAELIAPCVEREDDYEDNDSSAAASALRPGKYDGLQVCPKDTDVFAVTVKPGESIVAHLKPQPISGMPTLTVTDGQTKVLGAGFALKDGILAVALDPGEGTYYVEVAGDADAQYDLELQVLPPCPEGNDAEEQNDEPDKAKALAAPVAQQGGQPGAPGAAEETTKLLRICPGDVDWFRIGVTPESKLLVASIEFVHEKGDLNLTEVDADGERVVQEAAPSAATTNIEAVIVPPPDERVPDPTDYLLKVEGAAPDVQNFYVLTLKELPPSGKDGQPQDGQGDQNKDPQNKDNQDKSQDKGQDQPKDKPSDPKPGKDEQKPEERPDRATIEKAMEADDQQPENLEAIRAQKRDQLKAPAGKDW